MGRRWPSCPTAWPRKDYPHQCGEKSGGLSITMLIKGLPPPVWGEVSSTDFLILKSRITPTSVGRSIFVASCIHRSHRITPTSVGRRRWQLGLFDFFKDYPHQCGEKWPAVLETTDVGGLPPPVWGEGFVATLLTAIIGITPTSVGRSGVNQLSDFGIKDYPHQCGEKWCQPT